MKAFFFGGLYYRTNTFHTNRLTLVFVHGLSGSSSAWLPYEQSFENKYNVLTYDLRGHGRSTKFPKYSDYEMKHLAGDLHRLLVHLNISRFILVGHSLGAVVALEYVRERMESVLALVLLSPMLYLNDDFRIKSLRQFLKLSAIFALVPFTQRQGYHVDYDKYPESYDWHMTRWFEEFRNTTARVCLYCMRQGLMRGPERALEQLRVPTLIVHGRKDTLVSVHNSIMMSKKIENSDLVLLPEADHILVINSTNAAAAAGAIERFIEKNMTAGSLSRELAWPLTP